MFDQSIFVRAAIGGVVREALIAACLTAAMILLFLGNWRSTLIIAISIPLSIMVSILRAERAGRDDQHHDAGGLALAVGILVDDATVEIENINRNLAQGKKLCTRFWMERSRSRFRRSFRLCAFVSYLCRCFS